MGKGQNHDNEVRLAQKHHTWFMIIQVLNKSNTEMLLKVQMKVCKPK